MQQKSYGRLLNCTDQRSGRISHLCSSMWCPRSKSHFTKKLKGMTWVNSLSRMAKEVVEPIGYIIWIPIRYGTMHFAPFFFQLSRHSAPYPGENRAGGDHRRGIYLEAFYFRSTLSPSAGRGSGPNRVVGEEIDGSAVCLTLPPIPDNKINLHSSTLMKVPQRHHLFLLFSSLAPTLFLWRIVSKIKIKRDWEYYFPFALLCCRDNQPLKGHTTNFTHED